jgi:hypothetical protein
MIVMSFRMVWRRSLQLDRPRQMQFDCSTGAERWFEMSRSSNHRRGHHFVASEQLAIEFLLRYIVNPAGVLKSNWERPTWCNFVWFTDIIRGDIRTIEVDNREYGEIVVCEREVTFKLAGDPVVIITLRGESFAATTEYQNPSIAWAITRVRYRLRWQTGHDDGRWVDRTLMARSFSGLPPAMAPVG